jgi:hypothetical protein
MALQPVYQIAITLIKAGFFAWEWVLKGEEGLKFADADL